MYEEEFERTIDRLSQEAIATMDPYLACGISYKAKDLVHEGQFVALKKVKVPMSEDGVPLETLREIALLKHIDAFQHPNVVRLLDVCHGPRLEQEQKLILYMVFEHIDQDLATYINKRVKPGFFKVIKDISYQILSGIEFLHFNRIVHGDLRPQNILITNNGHVKLADFGLTAILKLPFPVTSSVVVKLWYRAPELLLYSSFTSAVDLWSCGCIFGELFRMKPLFRGFSELHQLRKIFEFLGCPEEEEWPDVAIPWASFNTYRKRLPLGCFIPGMGSEASDLLQKMLVFDPLKRISAKDAMNHAYFKDSKVKTSESFKKCKAKTLG